MKKLVLAMVAVMVATPAMATDWRVAGATDDAMYFIDMSRVTRSGNVVRFWEWRILRAPKSLGEKQWDNGRAFNIGNCATSSYGYAQLNAYLGRDFILRDPNTGPKIYAEPDSVTEDVIDVAC